MYIIIKSVGKCLIGRCAFFFVGQDIKSLKKQQQKLKINIKRGKVAANVMICRCGLAE
jgi:hypothetical protein